MWRGVAIALLMSACQGSAALGELPAEGRALPARYAPRLEQAAADLETIRARLVPLPGDLDGLDVVTANVTSLADELARAQAALASWPRELAAATATGKRPIVARALEQLHTTIGGPLRQFATLLPHASARITRLEAGAQAERDAAAALAAVTFSATLPGGATISGAREGLEHAVLAGFAHPEAPTAEPRWPEGWHALDRVQLAGPTGERLESNKSRGQLQNLARLLVAFPTLQLEFGGAGPSGEAMPILVLRKQARRRAELVIEALLGLGAPSSRLEIKRGPDHEPCEPPPAPVDAACVAASRQVFVRLTGD